MPRYRVDTQSVSEFIEANTPEEAIARSSFASVLDPARAELLDPPASASLALAGAPEATVTTVDSQTVSASDSQPEPAGE